MQEASSRELQAGDLHISPWEGDGENPPGNYFQTHDKAISSSEHEFMKEKSHLINLLQLHG